MAVNETSPAEPKDESVIAPSKPAPKPTPSGVSVSFDSSCGIDPAGGKTVTVNVAAAVVELPVDGTPVNVKSEDAELLLQSPAVKESK